MLTVYPICTESLFGLLLSIFSLYGFQQKCTGTVFYISSLYGNIKTSIYMRVLKLLFIITLLAAPAVSFSQSGNSASGTAGSKRSYHKKSSRTSVSKDSSDVTAILKDSANAESGPILSDNGNVSTTGIVDGSRSSTGRPGADTLTSYSVKKTRKTMRSGGAAMPDSTKRRKHPR